MSKCSNCRKLEAELDSWWDKIRLALFHFFFKDDIIDLSQDKFTQGFGDGYKMGWSHSEEQRQKMQELTLKAIKELTGEYTKEQILYSVLNKNDP